MDQVGMDRDQEDLELEKEIDQLDQDQELVTTWQAISWKSQSTTSCGVLTFQ